MNIYITGDSHGDIAKFNYLKCNCNESQWTADDLLIVCGDFGYVNTNFQTENSLLDDLEKRPYIICFVDGNHENFSAIYSYPVVDFYGGVAHRIRKNIYHLMRGQVYTIGGKTFFTMGGAYSIDKAYQMMQHSWWKEELPVDEEYKTAIRNLKEHNMQVDYIITHTMPSSVIVRAGYYPDAHDAELTGFFEWIFHDVSYKRWYCGHWHIDKEYNEGNITLLLNDVKTIHINSDK